MRVRREASSAVLTFVASEGRTSGAVAASEAFASAIESSEASSRALAAMPSPRASATLPSASASSAVASAPSAVARAFACAWTRAASSSFARRRDS